MKLLNNPLRLIRTTVFASALPLLVLAYPASADTRTIVDKIEKETTALSTTLEGYESIEVDMQAASQFRSKLAEQIRSKAPIAEQVLTSNQMIDKELSAIGVAIEKFDAMISSSRTIKGLIGDLISENASQNMAQEKKYNSQQLRSAASRQLVAMDKTLAYFDQITTDPSQRAELAHLRAISSGQIEQLAHRSSDVNVLDSLRKNQHLFTASISRLHLEKNRLNRKVTHLKGFQFGTEAKKTEFELASVMSKLNNVLGHFSVNSQDMIESETLLQKMMAQEVGGQSSYVGNEAAHQRNIEILEGMF